MKEGGLMVRTWHDNAREFRALSKQGYGVRLALLVACSVEAGSAGRPARNSRSSGDSKVSMGAFAREAGVHESTVARYLTAWDKMVAAGWDVPRSELSPAMADVVDLPETFVAEFDAMPKGGHVAKADELGISPGAAAIVNSSAAALAAAIKADPATAAVAREAVLEAMPKALVSAASREQLGEVIEAMVQRELEDAGLPPAVPRSKPGDPSPEWAKPVERIGLEGLRVIQMIDGFRAERRGDLADWCYRELRHTLLDLVTRLESTSVPDTPEGVNR
jgi:hypothetical protein